MLRKTLPWWPAVHWFGLILLGCWQAARGLAGPSASYEDQAVSLAYTLDLRFLWLDLLTRPFSQEAADLGEPAPGLGGALALDEDKQQSPRSLGLRSIHGQLFWRYGRETALQLGLRPDALLKRRQGEDPPTDFDGRAGAVLTPAPPIALVDSYRVESYWGDDFQLAYGVWEDLSPPQLAYPEGLAFGLRVVLPSKFSALRMRWRQASTPGEDAKTWQGWTYDCYLMQGRHDRVERLATQERSLDEGPSANDPYLGAAVQAQWQGATGLEGLLLLGYGNRNLMVAKTHESFAELALNFYPDALERHYPVLLSMDFRYSYETWQARQGGEVYAPLRAWSLSLTSEVQLAPKTFGLAGGHWGHAERQDSSDSTQALPIDGFQVEVGVNYHLKPGLQARFFINEEHREERDARGNVLASFRRQDQESKMLRRFALELQYQLAG